MSRIADWPHLFGYIITATGWTRGEVQALTLREANELLEYWSEHAPAHVLLAAMMRARPLRKRGSSGDLLSAVAGAGGKVSTSPPDTIMKLLGDHLPGAQEAKAPEAHSGRAQYEMLNRSGRFKSPNDDGQRLNPSADK